MPRRAALRRCPVRCTQRLRAALACCALHCCVAAARAAEVYVGAAGETVARQLQGISLPLVTDLDFQDLDLDDGELTGTVSWTPPGDVDQLTGYEVYLSDSANNLASRTYLGFVAVGTNELAIGPSLVRASEQTHLFVHSRTAIGFSMNGQGFPVCDVSEVDTITLLNGAALTQAWGVLDLGFYTTVDCSGERLRFAAAGSTGHAGGNLPEHAFDAEETTAWITSGDTYAEHEATLEIIGVDMCGDVDAPLEVKCVRIRQCVPGQGFGDCPTGAGRSHRLRLQVRGHEIYTWQVTHGVGLGHQQNLHGEVMPVPGRRRISAYGRFSTAQEASWPEQQTNPGFSR